MTPSSDNPRQPWYAEGLRFECKRCGACCRGEPGFVWVTREEMRRLADFLGMALADFRARYCRRVSDRVSLNELANGDCIFWKGECTVYPVRPKQCRTWPFWKMNVESEESWQYVRLRCPGCGRGTRYSVEEIRKILDT